MPFPGSAPQFRRRPLAALICLSLLLPATASAGWLDRLFGGSAAAVIVPEAPTPVAPESTDQTEAAGNTDAVAVDSGEQDAEEAEEVTVVLPEVQESALAEDDIALLMFSETELAEDGNLWDRLRNGFRMDLSYDNERIRTQRNWYAQRQDYLDRVAVRAARYLHYTVSEAEKRGLPTELALLPVIESAYDPFAYSHAHAAGMWQFIPGTGRIYGLKQNWWYDGRRDIVESTRAAYDFLTSLYEKFGSWELALASYNAGPGAVQRAINRNQAAGRPTDFWSLRLPAETMSYVPRFLGMAQLVKSPESFGVTLRPVLNQPYFREIATAGQIDLVAAAEIAGVSTKELYQLNPGFNRWATDPEGPHRLLVPASLPMDFEVEIASLPAPERVFTEEYVVEAGDTLFGIARRFELTAAEIRRLNDLKSDTLSPGQTLQISRPRASSDAYVLSHEQRMNQIQQKAGSTTRTVRYTVRKGDTLSAVARRHGVSTAALARRNGIRTTSHLRIGQQLTISSSKAAAPRTAQRAGSTAARKQGAQRIRYRVQPGDTLYSIGQRYNVSVKQIKRWNGTSQTIRPGQGLVIYVAGGRGGRNNSL